MFRDLGNSVSLGEQKIVFRNAVSWALEYLGKDDRIVWYLSILQRLALVENRGIRIFHIAKWKKKRKRKLEGWTGARIREDFLNCSPSRIGNIFMVFRKFIPIHP